MRALVLAAIGLAAMCGHAGQVAVPEWLPEDFRFSVSSNEAAEVEQTLALMRDALHPKLRAMMKVDDLGPTLQWIVHVSQPGKSDEAGYFETFKPSYQLTFDRTTLTNRAARLSILPQRVKLFTVFDDGSYGSVTRLTPGVDYPGVSYEDEGSTPTCLRLALRAPKMRRRFRIMTEASCGAPGKVEFKWIIPYGWNALKVRPVDGKNAEIWDAIVHRGYLKKNADVIRYFVFARVGKGFWGVPSVVEVRLGDLCAHRYGVRENIECIDYGDYVDYYDCDERGRLTGFTRRTKDHLNSQRFSSRGEFIVEAYSSGAPKVVRRVRYYIEDGKLKYEILPDGVNYKLGPVGWIPTNI